MKSTPIRGASAQQARRQDTERYLQSIENANHSAHALLVGCIAVVQNLKNTTLQRLLELALGQIDEIDVALAGLTEREQS